jgi:2-isopropylmalate synthase
LGERAGNASLEEVVMAVRTRQDMFNCDTRIETQHIVPVSRLVSSITGFPVQPNKAIVGANAFAHESGIHQDGVLKSRETYEIMRAEDVGWAENRMVLGKHSGRRAIRERLLALGIDLQTEEELNDVFKKFKELADKKHEIFDEDLQALITRQEDVISSNAIRLVAMDTRSTTEGVPTATITLEVGGEPRGATCEGDGVVDACFKAVEVIVASSSELLLYSVKNVTAGTDSQGEVSVRLQQNDRIGNGVGSDTDIVIASVKAYVNALNKLKAQGDRLNQKRGSGV